jgi:hypothetical protein
MKRTILSPLSYLAILIMVLVAVALMRIAHTTRAAQRAPLRDGVLRPVSPRRGHPAHSPKYKADELLVRFRPGVARGRVEAIHAGIGARMLRAYRTIKGLQQVRIPPGLAVEEAIRRYQRNPNVLYAEPNYIVHADISPNDPSFSQLWGLDNTGQQGGTIDADIDAPEAWDLSTGSSSVVIADIDSGIDYNHEDLAANVWQNPDDCNLNGTDDDDNGWTDDCHGIDTYNNDSDPLDDDGHGTHTAGTIGAVGNNGVGVVGVNWTVSIMACKFLGADGSGSNADAATCLDYIADMKDRGENIVATNNSWGGGGYSQALYDAIDGQRQRGILFIAAAGNGGFDGIGDDNDSYPFYPSSYQLPNVIAVAATTRTDALTSFSNFGRRTVDLGAPGSGILSTIPGDNYETESGTSMATPHVTGVAALLKAQNPGRDWKTIKNLILAGGDDDSNLSSSTVTGKRLNAYGAMTCSNSLVFSRLLPIGDTDSASVGQPMSLRALNINCGAPDGNVQVNVQPGDETVTLYDDGAGIDQESGDGIYSGQWTPSSYGTYTLSFPGGDTVTVNVAEGYAYTPTAFNYRNIAGTSLSFGDDATGAISSPFPVLFGGGSYSNLYVGSNGAISFNNVAIPYGNESIPSAVASTLVAPFWDDLAPVSGTDHNVFWAVTGAAPYRELVIEWRDVTHYNYPVACSSSDSVKFQAVFFEGSSSVLFNYADTAFGGGCAAFDQGASATVGVQSALGNGTQYSYNTASLSDQTSLLWYLGGAPTPPTLTELSPSSATAGGTAFTLTVHGLGFVGSTVVLWNGSSRPTTYVSDTELEAVISASDIASPGTALVSATTPGAPPSNALTFTISDLSFKLKSLSPWSASPGGSSFTLTVNGTGFNAGSIVRWNGANRTTTYHSAEELTASVPASDIAAPGAARVTVFRPGGGVTNILTFTIENGTLFRADFEVGTQGFTVADIITGLKWRRTRHRGTDAGHSFTTSFYFGDLDSFNYDTGYREGATLTSPPVTLGSGPYALRFNYFLDTEDYDGFDVAAVQISTDGGSNFSPLTNNQFGGLLVDEPSAWQSATLDLTPYANQTVLLRFSFDTSDETANFYEGWYLDDIVIGPLGPPNDNWASAEELSSTPYSSAVDTSEATTEGQDPVPGCSSSQARSVWYKLTLPVSGTVTADTFGSSYDTILSAYTGSPGSFVSQACSDDAAATLQSQVTFAGTAGVTYSFMVSAYSGDGGNLAFNLTFDSPLVGLSPPGLDFGAQPLNVTTSAQIVNVKNTGNVALHISGITIAGADSADFHPTNTCNAGSYAPTTGCTVSVTFKPTAGGPRSAELRVSDDALGSPQAVPLTGRGAGVSVSPASLNFGSVPVGSTSAPSGVTFTNLGAAPVHVWGTAIVGTNPGDFSRINSCPLPPATLAAGAHCAITVRFTPSTATARSASLMISHDGGASPSSVSLSGTGTAPLSHSAIRSGSSPTAIPRAVERLPIARAKE